MTWPGWRVVEVLGVYAALVPLFAGLVATGVMAWQAATLPYPFVTEITVLVGIPLLLMLASRTKLANAGLAIAPTDLRGLLLPVVGFTWLFTLSFLGIRLVGETFATLGGSLILSACMCATGVAMLRAIHTVRIPILTERSDAQVAGRIASVLGTGVIGVALTHDRIPILPGLFAGVALTALCEEVFFRGYVLSRLNDCFHRRWRVFNISVGPAVPVSAAMFGFFHCIPSVASGNAVPWAWVIWTTVFGLFAGALREKTGSLTAPWLMHGTLLGIRAFG